MNVLYIDTSDHKIITVKLQKGEKTFEIKSERESKAQIALELIEQALEKADLKLNELDSIKVKRGPGSYTGLKVGVSIVNALTFALQVPVNKKKIGELETPRY